MGFWDMLTGRPAQSSSTSQSSQHSQSSSQDSPSQSENSSPFSSERPRGVEEFLKPSTFADPSRLHPLAGLDQDDIEYLTLEDSRLSDLPGSQSILPSRGFTDDLCYGTGVTYLTALSLGGMWGLQEGLSKSSGQAPRLRLNTVLNSVTRRGPFLGNSAGVIAIVYNCINSYIGHLRGKHDPANTVLAGALSGMLFKVTRGVKPMMISGGLVASVAGVWAVVRRVFFEPGGP